MVDAIRGISVHSQMNPYGGVKAMRRLALSVLVIGMMSMAAVAGPIPVSVPIDYDDYDYANEPPFLGLPLGIGGLPTEQGSGGILGGITFGDPGEVYAARLYYNLLDMVCVFADIGAAEPDGADSGTTYQGGITVNVPVIASVRTTLTGAYAAGDFDGIDMDQIGGALTCSGVLDALPNTTLSASVGVMKTDVDADIGGSSDTTEFTASAGFVCKIMGAVKIYGQVAYMDNVFGSAGAGWNW
jgi:hypothetical protein